MCGPSEAPSDCHVEIMDGPHKHSENNYLEIDLDPTRLKGVRVLYQATLFALIQRSYILFPLVRGPDSWVVNAFRKDLLFQWTAKMDADLSERILKIEWCKVCESETGLSSINILREINDQLGGRWFLLKYRDTYQIRSSAEMLQG